jgi:putative DNA primase/helicase
VPDSFLNKRNGPCPFCGGSDRFRFTDQNGDGLWICNSCGPGNGFQFVEKWGDFDFKAACAAIDAVLPNAYVAPIVAERDPRAKLNALWSGAASIEPGDQVDLYLQARGLKFEWTPEIRTHENCPYWQDGKVLCYFSAMISRVRSADGSPKTLHVTYLQDGSKAPVPAPRKVLSKTGSAPSIRLWAPTNGTLCVTEGVETAIAVRQITQRGVWSLLSTGGMAKFECPTGVKSVEIWADNDESFAGQIEAFRLAKRLSDAGIRVSVELPSMVGTDWADR